MKYLLSTLALVGASLTFSEAAAKACTSLSISHSTSYSISNSTTHTTRKTTSTVPASSPTEAPTTLSTTTSATPTSKDVCYVTAYTDVPAATAACTGITLDGITVPGNSTLDLSKLKQGTTVTFAGTTFFEYADADYDCIQAGGTDITITGTPDAVIDGNGQSWWDGLGSNGGMLKPDHFFVVSKALGNSVIKDLYIQNWPTHCFSLTGCDGLQISNLVLNNSAGYAPNNRSDGLAAAHNSDGFGFSGSSNSSVADSIVLNQDDCVAVTSGDHITVSGMYCNGSHGLSIGSVGGKSNNNVTNILFEDSQVLNSQNGARIKTNYNTTGYIAGITYRNIHLENIENYGIDIQQDYLNGGPTGDPSNGVIIKDVTMENITGTVQDDGRNYYILCGEGSCSNFVFNDVHLTGGTNSSCNIQPEGDFVCAP